jgi:hypothetical protein
MIETFQHPRPFCAGLNMQTPLEDLPEWLQFRIPEDRNFRDCWDDWDPAVGVDGWEEERAYACLVNAQYEDDWFETIFTQRYRTVFSGESMTEEKMQDFCTFFNDRSEFSTLPPGRVTAYPSSSSLRSADRLCFSKTSDCVGLSGTNYCVKDDHYGWMIETSHAHGPAGETSYNDCRIKAFTAWKDKYYCGTGSDKYAPLPTD